MICVSLQVNGLQPGVGIQARIVKLFPFMPEAVDIGVGPRSDQVCCIATNNQSTLPIGKAKLWRHGHQGSIADGSP